MLVGSLHVSKYMIYNEFLYTSLMQVHLKKYNSLGVSVHHEYPANRHVLGERTKWYMYIYAIVFQLNSR